MECVGIGKFRLRIDLQSQGRSTCAVAHGPRSRQGGGRKADTMVLWQYGYVAGPGWGRGFSSSFQLHHRGRYPYCTDIPGPRCQARKGVSLRSLWLSHLSPLPNRTVLLWYSGTARQRQRQLPFPRITSVSMSPPPRLRCVLV